MEKEDVDFLHTLFRENNDLRLKLNALQRELFNRTIQNEAAEEEIRSLKVKLDISSASGSALPSERGSTAATASRPLTSVTPAAKKSAKSTPDSDSKKAEDKEKSGGPHHAAHPHVSTKEHQEVLFALERKVSEIKQLSDELVDVKIALDDQSTVTVAQKKEIQELKLEVNELRNFRTTALKEAEVLNAKLEEKAPSDITDLRIELEIKDGTIAIMKKQAIEMATDADRKHNELQNQVQGVEALIDGIRKEYEEFIQVTKLENESFRRSHQGEYNELKSAFESAKLTHFEEKKRLANEYGALLHSMQAQFEEYRIATEFMFSSEISKLEDELSLQAVKFEHEIMYVIQAKDKFYADMMVSKDAKIMNLIEGSDLQTLMQKHELDIENLRKDHAREIDMVKSDQESEQKNLISLLQRQNINLESKCEKLQAHLKTLETRIRELLGTIDSKIKLLNDREENRLKMETDYEMKLADCQTQISALSQEKEHLRHKVIRLNLNAKGEGGNSIENMIKRISRETTDLHVEFEQLSIRYDSLIGENQVLVKRLKEREKFAEFMEKEVARRTEEYVAMGLMAVVDFSATANAIIAKMATKPSVLRSVIPDRDAKPDMPGVDISAERKIEFERGNLYLRKFKTLSRAFATGDFRILPTATHYHGDIESDTSPGPWQKTGIYRKMDDANLALARLYKEPVKPQWDPASKPHMYNETSLNADPHSKVYTDKGGVASASKPNSIEASKRPDVKKKHRRMLSGNCVIIISDDEDDPLPQPSHALPRTLKRSVPPSATQPAPKHIRSYAPIAGPSNPTPVVMRPELVEPKEEPHALLWVPHHGMTGKPTNHWAQLDVVGVFSTKGGAEGRKQELIDEYGRAGYADICVGDLWCDEIDLVVKPCAMFGSEDVECKEEPHILVWIPHYGMDGKQGSGWDELNVIGVYSTQYGATERRLELVDEYDRAGPGDICVGHMWDDQIDLVVKPCTKFGFGGHESEETEDGMDPHILLLIENNSDQEDDPSEWDNLKVMIGVFSTEEAAREMKEEIKDEHEALGYGDICVKPRGGDPISLVVKPCDMFGFEAGVRPVKTRTKPHVLLRVPTDQRIEYDEEDDWDDLEVIGVFSTKEAAVEKWEELTCDVQEYDSCESEGYDSSNEEELIVKSCEMFGFDGL
ncbi:hypothetical protein HDU81_002064 [Chytriomyces hyalinus]|nr:hypothetical protein HDU81_002064 [Chytriomyces hyalinus]